MPNEMAIRLSDGPADELVRIHTEHTDWDEPDVRYLRRKPNGKAKILRPQAADEDKVVFEFGTVEVVIRAVEDHVEIVLRHLRPRAALAA